MVDVLNIGHHVLSQFHSDCPSIKKIFGKSDNAGSYHGNNILEALFKMCRTFGIELVRYDYNEPCKGKDQCDRESAGVKTLMNSYVSSGKDMMTANDMYDAVHYGRGIKNTKASVIEIDSENTKLNGISIPNISFYHSVSFHPTFMKMHRYYDIGPGNKVYYSEKNLFLSSYNVTRAFTATQKNVAAVKSTLQTSSGKKKKIGVRKAIFCQHSSCSDIFDSISDYEQHMLSGRHTITEKRSSMDEARASFVEKMKLLSQTHSVSSTNGVKQTDITLSEAKAKVPLMVRITERGWGLPRRLKFRYSYKQKLLLYNVFMDGEKSGRKKSPDETERLIRKHLRLSEYVTSQQIRSLFSSFAKQLKEGTLKEPQPPAVIHDTNLDGEIYDINDESEGNIEDMEQSEPTFDVVLEANRVFSELMKLKVGDYVAVRRETQWFPGKVNVIIEDGSLEVSLMKFADDFRRTNRFRWIGDGEVHICQRTDILLNIVKPIPADGSSRRIEYYELLEEDFKNASDVLKLVLRCK